MFFTSVKPLFVDPNNVDGSILYAIAPDGSQQGLEVVVQVDLIAMLTQVLNAIVQDIEGLALELVYNVNNVPTAQPATVVKRKGVKREPGVDQPFQITVCKSDEPEDQDYLAFGQSTTRWKIDITIVAPNQKDWLTNLDQYAAMREQIRTLYLPPKLNNSVLANASGIWEVRVDPRGFLDREQMANLFDESTVFLNVRTTP